MRRLFAVLGALITVLGVAVIGASSAQAQALQIGKCTTSQNVVLAVDFGHWGGPVVRACGSTPTTGFALLNQGGFRTEGTKHDGPAFICRIQTSAFRDGTAYPRPTEDDQTCGPTPPASAYWSYWHANAGQDSWSYSQLGAMSYKPKPGSVDLWQFGGTNVEGTKGQPTITPDDVRARNASSSGGSGSGGNGGGAKNDGATKRGGSGNDNGGGAAGNARRTAPGNRAATTSGGQPSTGPGSAAATTAARRPGASATTAASSAAPAAASSRNGSSSPAVIDADPASATPASKDSGSATPVVLGLGLALVLGAGAWFTMRRRRAEPEL